MPFTPDPVAERPTTASDPSAMPRTATFRLEIPLTAIASAEVPNTAADSATTIPLFPDWPARPKDCSDVPITPGPAPRVPPHAAGGMASPPPPNAGPGPALSPRTLLATHGVMLSAS